jgi:threonyl-tRNA synthetase
MKKLKDEEKLKIKRHSLAHILATAVFEMFPDAKFAIGPAIENGFYYDFDLPRTLIPEDLEILEDKMKEIIKNNIPFEQRVINIDEALMLFEKAKQEYKVELIQELKNTGENNVTIYKTGHFFDLCTGPHIESTGEIDFTSFKLDKVSGAYWRGDENKKQLQRIYGLAFSNKQNLKQYIQMMKEAEERNHRKIGKELELFANIPEIGQGLPVWLPKGYAMRRVLEDYMLKLERSFGYEHILTPVINKKELFETSGHLGFYKESMYSPIEIDNEIFYLKPMNCPAGMMVYKLKPKSYRELPLKMGELGTVYRYERSGELHGLQRVRGFTQNDAHIFCTPQQLKAEFVEVLEILLKFYADLGFKNYKFRLSLSDETKDKYVGARADWKKAEETMREVLKEAKVDFYEEAGEAAFYGPKLDIQAVNVFGKEDSISTIQVDFNLPERFDLTFIDKDGEKRRPFVIHRALIGSFERFFAFLIEYYAGAFPTWLAPTQIGILPVSEKFDSYGKSIFKEMKQAGIRVEMFNSDDSLGKRIAEAVKQKAPYLLIVGEQEEKDGTVAIRKRGERKNESMSKENFQKVLLEEIANKK